MAARRKTLKQVASAGDQRATLETVRDHLAELLDKAEPTAAAALARELRIVLEKLEALPGGREVSNLDRIESAVTDELAERRATRQPDTAHS